MNQVFILLEITFLWIVCEGNNNYEANNTYCTGSEWFPYKDEKCFKIKKTFSTIDQAKEICTNERSQANSYYPTLVTIKSVDEQVFLANLIFNTSDVKLNVWLGAKRLENSNKFIWIDGSNLTYMNWADTPSEENGRDCLIMQSGLARQSILTSDLYNSNNQGKWKDVTCEAVNYVICQKLQTWSVPQLQKTILDVRKNLQDSLENVGNKLDEIISLLHSTRNNLNDTQNDLSDTRNDLSETKIELSNTNSQLSAIKIELSGNLNNLEQRVDQRFEGIEGAFMSTFEVGGSADYYYPVAFPVHSDNYVSRINPRTPLIYDIFRAYWEKAPESINVGSRHYMGLSLKLMCSDGGWDAGVNERKVLLHKYIYNKGVAKVHLFNKHEYRLFVWLRGGGILYHIRSPINLSEITIYLKENDVASPPYFDGNTWYPAVLVSPIALGNEDPNLVKTGMYEGWAF